MADQIPDQSRWPVAVIAGLELNGLGLARALARRGIRVWAIGTDRTRLATSRAVDRFFPLPAWREDALIDGLVALGKRLDQPAVLLQTKDEGVLWTARHREALEPAFRIPLPDRDTVDRLMNKGVFYALAQREGWPLPGSWPAASEDELRALIPNLPFPCILKPQLKNSLFRQQSVPKAFKPKTPEELLQVYRLVAQWEREVVISEWIEGRDDQLVSCRGYWDRDARPVLRFVARKLLQWPVELGNMAVVEPAPREWWAEAETITQRIFDVTGMHGIGAVEFKRRPDGRLAILEPCVGRTVYSHEVAPLNGFDIPWACYLDTAFGRRIETPSYPEQPVKLFDGPRARASARVYRERGLLTEADLAAIHAGRRADMLFRSDDPLPWMMDGAIRRLRSIYGTVRSRLKPKPTAAPS